MIKRKESLVFFLIQIGTTILVVFLGFWLSGYRLNAQNTEKELDSKATKTEFNEFKIQNEKDHDEFVQKDQFEEFKQSQDDIKTEQRIIRDDIKEILKRLPK